MTRTREELEEERDFLLGSFRDLDAEHDAGDIDEADYVPLRHGYTARAAAVLRELDGERGAERGPSPSVRRVGGRAPRRARRWRTPVAVAAVVLVAAGAGLAVAATSGERLPGQEATGSLPSGTVDRISQAQALVSAGDALGAVKLYDELLRDDPRNPVALSERGWLVSRAGLIDEGLRSINEAIAVAPTYPEAHFFRGMILWQAKGDPAAAAEEFRLVLENKPPPDLASYVQDARQRALAAASQASPTPAGAGAPPPAG